MRPQESFDEVLEELVRLSLDMGALLGRLNAAKEGHVSGQRFNGSRTSGHTTVKHCFVHGEDKCSCGRGVPVRAVADPTGETAIRLAQHQDQARRDIGRYHEAVRLIRRGREILFDLHNGYMPHDPTGVEQVETTDEPDLGCVSCARLPGPSGQPGARRWEPPESENPRDGVLLCWRCGRYRRFTGEIPPYRWLVDAHAGKRVSWPGDQRSA